MDANWEASYYKGLYLIIGIKQIKIKSKINKRRNQRELMKSYL
jgi:hypothetical protein